jgi:transposase-like protein
MKTVERERARTLRAQGESVKDIARALSVAPSSVSRWVRDIELTPEQRCLLLANDRGNRLGVARHNRQRARNARKASQEEGRRRARQRDPVHMAGCMLYWAEGSRSRNSVCFTNSDPAMVRFFLDFLVSGIGIQRRAARIDVNLFADHVAEQRRIEQFWLDALQLPAACMRGSTVNVHSRYSARKRVNMLPYGTCRLCVHSTHLVQHIYGAIQEYGRFDRPEWLD